MNTLREIGEFVGIPRGSLDVIFGGPPVISLVNVSNLVTIGKKKLPMRAVIQALQNLTPITLEGEIVGSRSGEEPFEVTVRLNASGGITWFTAISISSGGKVVGAFAPSNSVGESVSTHQFGPGEFQLVASRAGISNNGFVSLSVPLGTISVSAPPPPPPPPPPPVARPTISVQSNGDGSFKVSGSGFVPKDARVSILVGDGTLNQEPINFTVTATDGAFKDFPTGKICKRSGTIFFEASDGRVDKGAQVFSNTVSISCPF
jgi:hypothetical protein